MSRGRRFWRGAFVVLFNIVMAVVLAELALFALLRMPSVTARTPAVIREFSQKVYRHFQRNLVQYDAACAQHDPECGYTLRPGSCTFGNLEFSHEYQVNSRGLRDTEDALQAPEVIFLGYSQAMGWGVAQQDAMPQALARQTGLKVLNAGISSYGTVRERKMLESLDRSNLRAVVIQYCDNDSPENQAFKDGGNHLTTMTRERFDKAVETTGRDARYYPGKYVLRLALKALKLETPEPDISTLDPNMTPEDEARLFINAWTKAGGADLDGIPVILFEINSNLQKRRELVAALAAVKGEAGHPEHVRDMALIETEGTLTPSDFYVIDDHLNKEGNAKIAAMVARALADRGVVAAP